MSRSISKAVRKSLDIYLEALTSLSDDFECSPEDWFSADADPEEMDPESADELQFILGYVSCVAEQLGVTPEVVLLGHANHERIVH